MKIEWALFNHQGAVAYISAHSWKGNRLEKEKMVQQNTLRLITYPFPRTHASTVKC